jgi:hypothetical protein
MVKLAIWVDASAGEGRSEKDMRVPEWSKKERVSQEQ